MISQVTFGFLISMMSSCHIYFPALLHVEAIQQNRKASKEKGRDNSENQQYDPGAVLTWPPFMAMWRHCRWACYTQHRSVAYIQRCICSATSVCLCVFMFVCLHDNFRTSKHRLMKLGGRCIVQKSRPTSNLGVIPPGCAPPQMWRCNDVGKISAGCLVLSYKYNHTYRNSSTSHDRIILAPFASYVQYWHINDTTLILTVEYDK